jgi:hypothetical protein
MKNLTDNIAIAQAHQYVEQMLQWQPRRIILLHGRWYGSNGVAELRRAFR